MIFKQETIQSWFSGVGSSINNEVIQPFQNAEQVIWKYNQAIQHNSLTQQGWERLLVQSDDSLKAYLTSIKGTTATMTGYNVSLQGNIIGFKKVSSAITQYNALSSSGTKEQNMFANAVSVTNGKLGTYLTGLNGAKASLGGYVISLVGATVKTVALKVATIALNSAITMGASLIISGVVSAISEWIHKTENMISASEDAIGKIKSINDELKNNQKTISDTAKRYAELAQGVDQLTGKNISLSNEDYEEFLTLSNQLAEMFPTLTRNYNDNGDAIVQLSGDVDTIVGSLQNLIEAQRDLANRQIVDELPTVFDGVAAKSDEYEQQLSDLESRRDTLVKSLGDVQSEEFSSNFMDGFSNKWIEISGDNLEVISQMRDDYMKILKEANIDFEELTPTYEMKDGIEVPVGFTIKINSSDEDVEKAKNTIDGKIQELASQYETDINKLNEEINTTNEKNKANWTSLSSSIFAWLSTDDSFKVMDDTMQATVQNIVNSLDWGSLDFSSWEDAKQYIQENILSLFNTTEGKETLADIEVMFGIQTQFNNGDITVEEYQQKLQDFLNSIENLPPETKKSILLLFGIQTNDDGTTTSDVDTMVENVKKKLKGTEFDDKVGELNLGDLKIAADLEVGDDTIKSWDDLIDRIEKVKSEGNKTDISFSDIFSLKDAENNLTDLGKINEEIDKFQSAYKGLKEAIDSYNETGTFTLDQVQEIISYGGDYLKYLMDENGNLQLNEEALNKVAIARINEMRAKALSNLMDNLDKITNEEQALSYLETQLLNTATAYDALTANRIKAWSENALENGISQETINKVTKSFKNQVSAINEMFNNISLDSIYKSSSSSAKKATEDAEKATKDYIDSYMDYMEKSLESGRINYQTYSRDVAKFLKDMYDQGKIAAKDYHDYTKEMLEVQKDIYDKALSAVTGLLDDEIDKYEECIKTVEKQNDALEEQKTLMENAASAVSDYYQKLIDGIENTNDALDEQNEKLEEQLSDMDSAINAVETYYDTLVDADQKTIDNLNEKNDSIQLQIEKYDSLISVADRLYTEEQDNLKAQQDSIQEKIDLLQEENNQKDLQYRKEEALYELQRSQQQRTKKLYVGDNGYIYDTDKKAIRDAQKNLQDIETEELVSSLEKEKEALQDSIDSLPEYRDALSEISDAYQKLVDERNAAELLGEGYKNLILETNIDDWLELKDKYIQANDEIADNEDLIKSHEDKIKIWEEEKEQWSSLPQSIIDETNKQKATEKFGADWEKQINEGRFNAFDSFKKNYLDIQSKINDNTETINSNNEKIEQYNKLKEEWDSLTNSLDENTKSQAAIQMFGADWEKQLNDGRLISYDAFKNQYLSIESQINDNTLLIDSYNEKIEYYENLKNQWNSVTSAYEDEMNKQYAAQIIGANWESDVLNGRLGTLDNFKNQYISIQQAIADAAWASANEQIKAAQAASDSANEQIKSSSPGGNHGYKAYIGNELIGVYNSKNEANDAAQKEVSNRAESEARKAAEKNGGKDATSIYNNTKMGVGSNLTKKIKIKPYASGTNNAKKGLNLVGEDGIETFIDNEGNISLVTEPTLIPMEGGEIVKNEKETKSLLDSMNLVPIQTGDIWKKFATNMPDLSSMINVNVPDYSKISGMFSKAQTIEQHNQFNVTLPNITDSTKATKLFEELQRLPLDALQYANTRKK